ncbi:NAD-dependent epimerase/dehydratase family protein [Leucothrix sargassi]|nr:NAD-dependent epimerase/dehydratase family protein [Leucothrix sargassi]
MKTAIVLGATGLVGSNLVEQLSKAQGIEKVIAITRRSTEYTSEKIINEVINFDELAKYSDVFKGDILFSCLGTTIKQAGSVAAQRVVDYDYQYDVAKMSAENGVGHYILLSSSGANASSKSAYLKMKGELEQDVVLLPFERISILQPSLLTGERNHFRLGEVVGSWILPALCKLPFLRKYRPITGEEVANKMVSVALSDGSEKETFTLDEIFN